MKGRQKFRGVGGKVRTVVQLALLFVCHHCNQRTFSSMVHFYLSHAPVQKH